MTNLKNTLRVGLIALITRIVILTTPLIFKMLIFNENSYTNFTNFLNQNLVRWDAHHFLYISKNWYVSHGDAANYIVFQPLYPFLIKITNLIVGNHLISALIISNFAFILGVIVFYKVLRIDYPERISERAAVLLSIFPTSYFFSLPYAESVFFLLVISSFYLARKQKWFGAGIMISLAGITKYFGFILIPAFLFEIYKLEKSSKKLIFRQKLNLLLKKISFSKNLNKYKPLLAIILPSIFSLGIYLYINIYLFESPFAFSQILKDHWYKTISPPWKGIIGAVEMSKGWNPTSIMIGSVEAITTIVAWALVPFSFKKLQPSWAVYYFLGVLLFSSTGFLLSTPRYLLSLPPFFLILSLLVKKEKYFIPISFIFINLLSYFSLLYVVGQWSF